MQRGKDRESDVFHPLIAIKN